MLKLILSYDYTRLSHIDFGDVKSITLSMQVLFSFLIIFFLNNTIKLKLKSLFKKSDNFFSYQFSYVLVSHTKV